MSVGNLRERHQQGLSFLHDVRQARVLVVAWLAVLLATVNAIAHLHACVHANVCACICLHARMRKCM